MSRQVLLPVDIDRRLVGLTGLVQEVNGILLYKRGEQRCPVDTLLVTGVGSEGHVQSQPARMSTANEFFRCHPDYHYIKFHTHSISTIERFGAYYATHFSNADIEGIQLQLADDVEFMALLVTPQTKLLSGMDNPILAVVAGFPEYAARNQEVKRELQTITNDLGQSFGRISATIRR